MYDALFYIIFFLNIMYANSIIIQKIKTKFNYLNTNWVLN